jgi:hypothetical protein
VAKPTTLFLGQDVHRDFVTVAHADAHRSDPPLFVESNGSLQAQTVGPSGAAARLPAFHG